MAAKPPKPPGKFLNQNKNTNTTNAVAASASAAKTISNIFSNDNNNNDNNQQHISNSSSSSSSSSSIEKNALENATAAATGTAPATATATATKSNCNCTNISIMHLFHEMKQEFPTIPDPIVTQCVNDNCHQRENCLQLLRNELALHPIPVQTYPAKVLHQQRSQQLQQLKLQPKPATAIKPTRVAPLQPPTLPQNSNSNASSNTKAFCPHPFGSAFKNQNCDSVEFAASTGSININNNYNIKSNNQLKDVKVANSVSESSTTSAANTSDMPTVTTTSTPTPTHILPNARLALVNSGGHSVSETNGNETPTSFNNSPTAPRARPTTLNLQTQQQQQSQQQQQQQQLQRQQLNIQLQQHFQQRNHSKPLRKAPLPPIPPKPLQFSHPHSPQFHHSTSSLSNESSSSCLASPISSGESEISVNVSLSSPTQPQQQQPHYHNSNNNHQQPLLKSPIRHRSVITVQPEPPYTRDFLLGSSPTSSSGGSQGSQKSFTSVNLTLRQPNSSIPQSTIDISAGPGRSGAGGSGLTYSSTSYDARRGFQKNFHITVTDEGGIFSASRIRPRGALYADGNEIEGTAEINNGNGGISPVRANAATSEQNFVGDQQQLQQYPSQLNQQQQRQQLQQQQLQTVENNDGVMCMSRETDGFSAIIQRQKARRDKLATALRDNKKRLSQVEQEVNVLMEPVSAGSAERLDSDIQKLRCHCEVMLNEIENARRCGPSVANSSAYNSVNNRQPQQLQQQPQPFPRQHRPPRPPLPILNAPAVPRQPGLDFVQHHSSSSGGTPVVSTPQQQQPPPPTYQQYYQQYQQPRSLAPPPTLPVPVQQQQQQMQSALADDDDYYSDSQTDGDDDEEPLEMWACNMCTFRNHPQLNICECCDNVRIHPGMIRIVPATVTAAAAANTPAAAAVAAGDASAPASSGTGTNAPATTSLENDANLTQQQLQQFALHT